MPSFEHRSIGNSPDRSNPVQDLVQITNSSEFVTEILLAQYRTLRDEILKKMDHRTSLVACSVTVSSAVLGFGLERQSGALLLVSPLVSLLLGILILYHNVQIGDASAYLRKNIELPISSRYHGYIGWHETKNDREYRLKQRAMFYHLPLVLIAIAPAIVVIPLALSKLGPLSLTIPVLVVDISLLLTYSVQIFRYRNSI